MGQRARYWSCTKFAGWLRGTPKPEASTGKEWGIWRKTAQSKHKIRYWLAEEALDSIQDFLWSPVDRLYDVKYYINNRWVTKTHALTAHRDDIKPGRWQDVGNRFLPCLFNELVDYVEIELAWANIAWDKEARKKYYAPRWSWGWFRWRVWRCPEAGLDHLRWQMSLKHDEEWTDVSDPLYGKPTPQAISATEIYELYHWWKNIYKNRPDPMKASGWSAYCDMRREKGYDLLDLEAGSEEEEQIGKIALDKNQEIEAEYEREDTEMLIRLIKIRNHLWT